MLIEDDRMVRLWELLNAHGAKLNFRRLRSPSPPPIDCSGNCSGCPSRWACIGEQSHQNIR